MSQAPIVITPGEPAGIGPDLVIQIAQDWAATPLVIAADPDCLTQRAQQLGKTIDWPIYSETSSAAVSVLPVPLAATTTPGQPNPDNAAAVLNALQQAAKGCIQGAYSALVTGPVHKGIINDAGLPFLGHTEFFSEQTGCKEVVMTFLTPFGPVGLMTAHIPLHAVPATITASHLENTIITFATALQQQLHMDNPNIAVCGLNPHAGENGHLGSEEQEIIIPTLQRLQNKGYQVSGPFAADSLFAPHNRNHFDAFLTLYHDQGLPVVKALAFGNCAQISLGLPFLRLSVDHGTALSLAGTGKADPGSLLTAIRYAERLSNPVIPSI